MRGINSKLHDIYHESTCHSFAILAITETWLSNSVADGEIFDTNFYSVFRCDRDFENVNLVRGGGVCLGIESTLTPISLNLKSNPLFADLKHIDILGIKLKYNHFTFYIVLLYIPPNTSIETYRYIFDALSSLHNLYGSNLILLGDFNISEYAKYAITSETNTTIQLLNEFSNLLLLDQANQILNSSNRLLDLVLSNIECDVSPVEPIVPIDPHHPPLLITLLCKTNSLCKSNNSTTSFFNYKRGDLVALYQDIGSTQWDFLNNCNNVDNAFELFYEKLNDSISKYVPLVKPRRGEFPVWYTFEIIKSIRTKHKHFCKFKSSGDVNSLNEFRRLRSEIKAAVKVAYKAYCQNVENSLNSDPKKFWRFVQNKSNTGNIPTVMKHNDHVIEGYESIADAFAQNFSSAYTLPSDNNSIFASPSHCGNLSCRQLSEEVVHTSIKKLKPNFTMGPDKIPAFLIRDCASVLSFPLAILFNKALTTCTFPTALKQAKIIPIYKRGDKSCIENHRPITILNNFSKVFEFALYDPIYEHVKHILSEHQHGFIKGRSTSTNLLHITQFISSALDKSLQVDVIYTDLSKAFDKLDHTLLLSTLSFFGFSDDLLLFFKSYLYKRSQYVDCYGHKSSEFIATSGVPQGSILGPLFFCLFIDSILENINVPCLLYADDLKIFGIIEQPSDCITLQNALQDIYDWCNRNKMILNVPKCHVVSYSLKHNDIVFDYTLNDTKIPRSNTYKDLGVIFDRELSFVPHINNILNDSCRMLGFIFRTSGDFLETSTRKLLFFTYVRSKLEYASIVWSPYYTTHIDNLERVERRFLKYLAYKEDGVYPRQGFPQHELLSRFGMKSLEDRRIISGLLFLRKLINGEIDSSTILSMLNFRVPRTASRSTDLFYLPTTRININKFSPIARICSHGNLFHHSFDIFSCSTVSVKNYSL